MPKPENPTAAFGRYIDNPIIQTAMEMSGASVTKDLLRDCFMAGAGYAIKRCKAEHHATPQVPDGHMIVPVEPTQQMLSEGCKAGLSNSALFDDTRFSCERAVWTAMLAHVNKLN